MYHWIIFFLVVFITNLLSAVARIKWRNEDNYMKKLKVLDQMQNNIFFNKASSNIYYLWPSPTDIIPNSNVVPAK